MAIFKYVSKSVATAVDRLITSGAAAPHLRWAGGADYEVRSAKPWRWSLRPRVPRRRKRSPWRAIPASVVCAALAASDALAIVLAGALALLAYGDLTYIARSW